MFDPVVHRQIPYHDELMDPRWVVCERPCITVGGELSREMLELQTGPRDARVYFRRAR